MGIAELVAQAREVTDDGVAITEDVFEGFFSVLARSEPQDPSSSVVKFRQVILFTVASAGSFYDVLANCLQQGPGGVTAPSGSVPRLSSAFFHAC